MDDMPGSPTNTSSKITINGQLFVLDPPTLDFVDVRYLNYWSADNVTFNSTWIEAKSICQPSDRYQWGISFLMLFIFCVLTVVFVILLCGVWYNVYWNSRADGLAHDFNVFSAVMDLASSIVEELGPDAALLSPKDLKEAVLESTGAMTINIDNLPLSRRDEQAAIRKGSFDPMVLPNKRGLFGYCSLEDDFQARSQPWSWLLDFRETARRCWTSPQNNPEVAQTLPAETRATHKVTEVLDYYTRLLQTRGHT